MSIDSLPFFLSWLCKVVEFVSNICHIARAIEALCFIAAFIKNFVVGSLARPFRNAISEVYDIFYFNVSIYYKFSFNATQSRTYSEVKDDILKEVEERLGNFTSFLNFVDYFMMFAVVFILIKSPENQKQKKVLIIVLVNRNIYLKVLKALVYRYKYLTKDSFDNVYLTFKVQDIDERRIEIGKESIMPLDWKERGKYINSRSIYMAMCEKRKLAKGLVLLLLSMCHAGFYMACDFALYWLLNMMKTHLSIKTKAAVPAHLKMHVNGKGALADMYRALLSMFDPLATDVKVDTAPCLPNPYTPNFSIYEEIGTLYGLCMFLVIFEAYGLRLRHIITGCYYPDRERARAVWLYNHIIKTRGGMLKYTRRQLRRTFGVTKRKEEISLRGKLAAHYFPK
ncbi:hypothetical protein KUTeg_019453 [Tegillarca granosa]|uniref:Dendritic cell-specific transmembrane protein-like domain-containing protein n=1 Tax=Tegillarca granosa TaxID=220873 RepID=A0ABQ9EHK6_TEGGR|nr:hypothetical protein KUTeg_019453 [Tegillarca granosa]